MDTWNLLSPDYISEFFAMWYTEWWAKLLMCLLLGLPLILFLLTLLTKCLDKRDNKKTAWHQVRLLILIHKSYKVCQKKNTCYIWIIVGILILVVNIIYAACYFQWGNNPNIITTGSLQTLSYLDFKIARQFLSRYIALGWSLMLISLAFCMLFLEKGLMAAKCTPIPILKANAYSLRRKEVKDEHIIDSSENRELIYRVTDVGDVETNTEGKNPSLLVFKYEKDLTPPGWYMIIKNKEVELLMDDKVLSNPFRNSYKLDSYHWLQWTCEDSSGTEKVALEVIVQ